MSLQAHINKELTASARNIRCLLVHEHVSFRQGVRRLLEDEFDLEVVSEAGNAAECLRKVFEFRPDVVIADNKIFGLSASEAELLLQRVSNHTKLFFLNIEQLDSSKFDAPESGGSHPTPPQSCLEDLVKRIRNVYGARTSLAAARSMEDLRGPAELQRKENTLTAREREVLKLLAEGKTVRATAVTLGVSSKTVEAHKFNLMRKLGVHNKAQLVIWAIRTRMVEIPPSP
ncbi:MAG TPA: response regulator transcription factor [Candidatus Acidoferrum sp.]|nr:response regulator transcription factor [Candidatus Acidoferrum sp.]